MSNVESAAAAGDNYNLRHVLLADGTGAVVGAAPRLAVPARRLHRPAGLEGRRRAHLLLAGHRRAIFLLCVFGLFPLLAALLPIPAIVPVLLFIGLAIGVPGLRRGPQGALRGGRAGRDPVAGPVGLRAWSHDALLAAGHVRGQGRRATRWPTAACSTAGCDARRRLGARRA